MENEVKQLVYEMMRFSTGYFIDLPTDVIDDDLYNHLLLSDRKLLHTYEKEPEVWLGLGYYNEMADAYECEYEVSTFHFLTQPRVTLDERCYSFNGLDVPNNYYLGLKEELNIPPLFIDQLAWLESNGFELEGTVNLSDLPLSQMITVWIYQKDGKSYQVISIHQNCIIKSNQKRITGMGRLKMFTWNETLYSFVDLCGTVNGRAVTNRYDGKTLVYDHGGNHLINYDHEVGYVQKPVSTEDKVYIQKDTKYDLRLDRSVSLECAIRKKDWDL